ncbi:MAG TPA: PDZ domain-containing protein, partial [Pyrinomonadaceae bacterium]|nr:PDZ domain-containing protein [Pyrinomonadaceae bacterium]
MRLRFTLIGLLFALMSAYVAATAYHQLAVVAPRGDSGWLAREGGGRLFVSEVSAGGPAAALRAGDEVLTVDGQLAPNLFRLRRLLHAKPPGSDHRLVVRRGGQTAELTLRHAPLGAMRWAYRILVFAFVPAAFILAGLIVFLLKPENKQAVLLAVSLMLMVGVLNVPSAVGWWLPGVTALGYLVGSFFPAVFLHIFLVFPEPAPPLRRFPRLELWLYVPFLLTYFPLAATYAFLMTGDQERGHAF